jgi:L-fuconolactonase
MGTSTFFRGLAAVGERDLAYDVLVYAPQLRGAFELCRALPRQRFVLDHLGKPEARTKRIATWRHDLMALASLDHVACKLSGLATEADWGAWTPAHLRTYLDIALDVFGPSRLLFGSDWPVALCAVSYERWHDLVRDWASALTASEQASVFGGAASRVYRL